MMEPNIKQLKSMHQNSLQSHLTHQKNPVNLSLKSNRNMLSRDRLNQSIMRTARMCSNYLECLKHNTERFIQQQKEDRYAHRLVYYQTQLYPVSTQKYIRASPQFCMLVRKINTKKHFYMQDRKRKKPIIASCVKRKIH